MVLATLLRGTVTHFDHPTEYTLSVTHNCLSKQMTMLKAYINLSIMLALSAVLTITLISSALAQTNRHELAIGYGEPSFGHLQYKYLRNNHSFGISAGTSIALQSSSVRSLMIEYNLYWGKAKIDSELPKFYYSPSIGIIFLSDLYGNFIDPFSHTLLGIANVIGAKFYLKRNLGFNIDLGLGAYSGNIYDSWGCYECDNSYQPFRPSFRFKFLYRL